MPSSACSSGCSGEEAELLCRGDRLVHSSRPLEAAAVAELHVALAFRGCHRERVVKANANHDPPGFQHQVFALSTNPGYDSVHICHHHLYLHRGPQGPSQA